MLSFCREGMSAAVKDRRDRLVIMAPLMHTGDGRDQEEQIAFSQDSGSTSAFFDPIVG